MSITLAPHTTDVVGIFGAGKSATALARRALDAGYEVKIATSADAADTAMMVDIVAPGAVATDTAHLAEGTDLVIIAVPLRRFRELPLHSLAGRVVIDLMNYWPPVDGILPEFEESDQPSSVLVRDALPDSVRLVKTFNHLGYHQMEDLALPAGAPRRAAVALAGDDPSAVDIVARFVERVGFDPVTVGTLQDTEGMQPEGEIFGRDLSAPELTRLLADRDRLVA
jgi:8-hydroxy-5-deazaflavin:NADPH oxidoreductase